MRTDEMPDGLTDTQYKAWDWLCAALFSERAWDLDYTIQSLAEDSPFRLATWRAMEKKGWVKLHKTTKGHRIEAL